MDIIVRNFITRAQYELIVVRTLYYTSAISGHCCANIILHERYMRLSLYERYITRVQYVVIVVRILYYTSTIWGYRYTNVILHECNIRPSLCLYYITLMQYMVIVCEYYITLVQYAVVVIRTLHYKSAYLKNDVMPSVMILHVLESL